MMESLCKICGKPHPTGACQERESYDHSKAQEQLSADFESQIKNYLTDSLPEGSREDGPESFTHEGKVYIEIEGGNFFAFDPNKIQIFITGETDEFIDNFEEQTALSMEQAKKAFRDEHWIYIGKEARYFGESGFHIKHLFARPWIIEGSFQKVEGVETFIYKNISKQMVDEFGNICSEKNYNDRAEYELAIQAGTLRCYVYSTGLENQGADQQKNAVEIDIARVDEGDFSQEGLGLLDPRLKLKTKNPKIARTSFIKEMRMILEQMKRLGYKQIIGRPSDERRERLYKLVGMKSGKVATRVLFADIEDILSRSETSSSPTLER